MRCGSIARALGPALLASLLAAGVARAQSSSEVAAARALFTEGLEAARANRWEEARERFARSYAIAARPNTLLNLAGAEVQTGRLVEGAESYRRFLAEARSGREARYRAQAQEALTEVEARLARLVVRAEGLLEADVVALDGSELARGSLGVELPVNPGARVVTVQRAGEERAREVLTLAEGERREVALRVAAEPSAAAEAPASPRAAPEAALRADPAADGGGDDTALFVGLGVGAAVLVAVGVTIAVVLALDGSGGHTGNLGPGVITFD
ncbi:MAG: hypothetical protein KF729_30670 [Sandaracinaceae bacterium]|nr:hypothetical protein [Sandaracinaceae bacterium]